MCAAVVPRLSPVIVPRAYWSHHGAPMPVSAGTKYTPPLSPTLRASLSTSDDERIMPSPSRSHCTTEPPTKMLPSNAYAVLPAIFHATVVSRLFFDMTGLSPQFISRKQPVP